MRAYRPPVRLKVPATIACALPLVSPFKGTPYFVSSPSRVYFFVDVNGVKCLPC